MNLYQIAYYDEHTVGNSAYLTQSSANKAIEKIVEGNITEMDDYHIVTLKLKF